VLWQFSRTVTKLSPSRESPAAFLTLMAHKQWSSLLGADAMLQVDPWGKAAECERAIEIVADPERRTVLNSLRSVWVALGNKRSFLETHEQTVQLSNIAQIHTELMLICKNAMH
jgi:hypothetical protein